MIEAWLALQALLFSAVVVVGLSILLRAVRHQDGARAYLGDPASRGRRRLWVALAVAVVIMLIATWQFVL